MIDKEVERKIAYLHAIYGLVSGTIAGLYHKSPAMPFLSVLIWAFILSYPLMILTRNVFKLSSEDYNLKTWLGKGFIYFFLVWIVVWVFVYNIR